MIRVQQIVYYSITLYEYFRNHMDKYLLRSTQEHLPIDTFDRINEACINSTGEPVYVGIIQNLLKRTNEILFSNSPFGILEQKPYSELMCNDDIHCFVSIISKTDDITKIAENIENLYGFIDVEIKVCGDYHSEITIERKY